jgi:hypothetical protein
MGINARVATNPEHRINAPNASPRIIRLYGLGAGGRTAAHQIATAGFPRVDIIVDFEKSALAARDYPQSDRPFDMLVLAAAVGDDVSFAPSVYEIGVRLGVSVICVFHRHEQSLTPEPSLALLRASSDILVITSDPDYLAEMLLRLTNN